MIQTNEMTQEYLNNIRIRIFHYGYASMGKEWVGNIVSPPYGRLYYICGGDGYIRANGKEVLLKQGHCYLFPSGYSFSHGCTTSVQQLYFHIKLLFGEDTDLLQGCSEWMEYTPGMEQIQKLVDLSQSEEVYDSLRLRQEIYASVLELFQKYEFHPRIVQFSPCVLQAIAYVKSHLSLRLHVSEVAAHGYVSESMLTKRFRAEMGISLGRYIDDMVLLEAERLLSHTGRTVQQISEQLGFGDPFYFSRRFKSKYGSSPRLYRKIKSV